MKLSGSQERRETLGSELLNITSEFAERVNQLVVLDEGTDRSNEPLSLEEILSRVCSQLSRTYVEQENLNGKLQRNLPVDLHIDLEPVEYGIRGDSSLIERSLVTLVLAVWRSRTQKFPLRIQGSRTKSVDRDSKFIYYLTVSFGDQVVRENSTAVTTTTSFPPAASPFGTWENGKDLELLGAFALLQAQGCWVETHPGIHGGLCFEIELALDPNRPLDGELVSSDELRKDSSQYVKDVRAVEHHYSDSDTYQNNGPVGSSNQQNRRAYPPILICDDEPRLIALTAGLLREFGFEVLTVRSGAEAIKVAGSQPIDLVVLDINLPGEDARDILVEMQRIAPISVILSSGYTEEDVDPRLLREPAVKAFLSKPYTVDILVQTIDRVRAEVSEKNQSQS
jgi:DNA-binding response OmpR family regulator